MTNSKAIGKALLWMLTFIVFNILTDILLFGTQLAPKHFGAAILGGIGGGLGVAFMFNRNKNSRAKFSSDLK